MTLYTPGAVTLGTSGFSGAQAIERNVNGTSEASVNGNRLQNNSYNLDGIDINETMSNSVGYNPSPDALGEMKIISANAPPEYGNVNSGDIIAITKSGTNTYHGSAFFFVENQNLDANTWSNKNHIASQILPRNPYTPSIFGGTLGGPIKRDKLLFFIHYEGARYHSGGKGTATVLSAKMRQGDFSELLKPAIMCSSTGGVVQASTP